MYSGWKTVKGRLAAARAASTATWPAVALRASPGQWPGSMGEGVYAPAEETKT